LLCRASEVGMNLEQLKVAYHKERRIVQILAIFEELLIGDIEVFVLALVFPTKIAALPNIGKARFALNGGTALSNVYVAPEKSSEAGCGSPSTSQSSIKCIWAPARSVRSALRHLLTKSGKVSVGI